MDIIEEKNKRLHYFEYLKNDVKYTNSNYKIYALICPYEDTIFYIGCTKDMLYTRINYHYSDITAAKEKHDYLIFLFNNGKFPIIEILYTIKDKKTAHIIEKSLINFLFNNKRDIELLNKVYTKTVNFTK